MERGLLPERAKRRLVKTALHQAVLDVRLHQVRLLVARHGVAVDCRDLHGRTPLMLACMLPQADQALKIASILLKAGANLNVQDTMGRTALSYACVNGLDAIVIKILNENILDVNEPDNDGNTPIHLAAINGNPDIVRQLAEVFCKFGLNADKRNKLGYTPLLLACKHAHFQAALTLLKVMGASPTLSDSEFHLNAAQWTTRSQQKQDQLVDRIFLSSAPVCLSTPSALSFTREYSMYQPPPVLCPHSHARPFHYHHYHPHAISLEPLSPRLPPLSSTLNPHLDSEDEKAAGKKLLKEIREMEVRQQSSTKAPGRFSHPPTAKLLAMSRRIYTGVPHDVVTLFRLYADQYQPLTSSRAATRCAQLLHAELEPMTA